MEGLVMAGQLILGLSILVGLHEFGHLLAAKAFGMRVEKYSIGFPPKIWGKQIGETEYSFGLIPLGGFVKITGMIDESLDVKSLSEEPEPYEFRAKPAWQRLIVMMGGIIVNVITGIIIFVGLTYTQGETFLSKDELNKHGIVAYELGEELGFQTGDKVVNINGEDYIKFRDLMGGDVLLSTDGYYTVDRNGKEVIIPIPNDFIDHFADKDNLPEFISYRMLFEVSEVIKGSNAELGGLMAGDRITEINGVKFDYFDQFSDAVDTLKNQQISLAVSRGLEGETTATLDVLVDEEGTLGFYPRRLNKISTVNYTFAESIPKGTNFAFSIVWNNIKAFKKMFAGDVSPSKSLSGPIGIAKFFGGTWDWMNFWRITGLLSMVLAFMNFLPIPALDGGHVMFLTWEIVTGRKPSDKFLENAQKVGMVLLLGIMGFAILNDIVKLF